VAQVHRGGVHRAPRELDEPGDAPARPAHDGDGIGRRTQQQVERRIVAAG
jgi:hypothetical protein